MNKSILKNIWLLFFLIVCQLSFGQEITSWTKETTTSYLYERTDFEIQLSASFSNPYDAIEIALDLVLTSPSNKELVLPCYFVSGDQYNSVWNARFLPQEEGKYFFYFRLKEEVQNAVTSEVSEFEVLPSAKNGILHTNDYWTLKYDSGKPFRGIGENVGWEARNWEDQKYTYDYFLPKLAKNGVNFFRAWTCIWNLPIEWQTVINTNFYTSSNEYFNPGGVQRMDELMEMLDSLDMHLMLALVPHGALITTGEWSHNPYNVVNGGPASTPTEFFTLEASKQKFKNTLRYLVARWGYSPGIGAWEFCNEIDNAAYNGGGTLSIPEAAITNWHKEMSAYLKQIDIYHHPITTSISHREITGLYEASDLDINQQHIYNNTSAIPEKINYYKDAYNKPFVIGEFGWDWNWDNVLPENGPNFDFDLKRGLWYGLFTSTPILPMTWWWEFFDDRNMTSYYKNIAAISEQMLLAGDGNFEPVSVNVFGFEKFAVKCGSSYFVYLLNNSTNQIEAEVKVPVIGNQSYFVRKLDPSKYEFSKLDAVAPVSGEVNLGRVSLKSKEEVVFIFSLDEMETGSTVPYSGTEHVLPGAIEAEDFDIGLEGTAFHDFDSENTGGVYRSDSGVDIFEDDAITYVGDLIKGEWLKYSVQFSESGTYEAAMEVRAEKSGGSFRLLLDGVLVSEVIEISENAGGNWQTITIPLTISQILKGNNSLKIEFLTGEFSVNQISFSLENKAPEISLLSPEDNQSFNLPANILLKADAADEDGEITKVAFFNNTELIGEVTSAPYEINWNATVGKAPIFAIATDDSGLVSFSDTAIVLLDILHSLPGTIEAEDYTIGENGEAYYDLSDGNKFGFYREDDVDIELCVDEGGGYSVGDFQSGEWLRYAVQVSEMSTFQIDFRVATQMSGGSLSLMVDDEIVASSIAIPNTGGWQVWTTISVGGIHLEKGEHVIKLGSVSEFVNVNRMVFDNVTSVEEVRHDEIACYPNPVNDILNFNHMPQNAGRIMVYNNLGQLVLVRDAKNQNIDVNDLDVGFYNLVILSKDSQKLVQLRFVKY